MQRNVNHIIQSYYRLSVTGVWLTCMVPLGAVNQRFYLTMMMMMMIIIIILAIRLNSGLTDCWTHVHLSTERSEQSSSQFWDDMWSVRRAPSSFGFQDRNYSYKISMLCWHRFHALATRSSPIGDPMSVIIRKCGCVPCHSWYTHRTSVYIDQTELVFNSELVSLM